MKFEDAPPDALRYHLAPCTGHSGLFVFSVPDNEAPLAHFLTVMVSKKLAGLMDGWISKANTL